MKNRLETRDKNPTGSVVRPGKPLPRVKRLAYICAVVLVGGLASTGLSQKLPKAAPPPPPPAAAPEEYRRPSQSGTVQDAVWSPDGRRVAFSLWFNGRAGVFVAAADGRRVDYVSSPALHALYPVWAPNGKELYFTGWVEGNADICRASVDGSNFKCLTNSPSDESMPAVSPDGKRIAYCLSEPRMVPVCRDSVTPEGKKAQECTDEKAAPRIFTIDRNGLKPTELFPEEACYPAWSPDGKSIAFVSRKQLIIMDLKNGKTKKLTNDLLEAEWNEDSWPVWSPKGNRLAFIGTYQAFSSEIYTINPNGKKIRKITDNLYEDFRPSWKPDGKEVIYASYVAADAPEIFICDQETPKKRQITKNHLVDMNPSFSPDGRRILVVRRIRGQDVLYLMDPDGKNQRPFFTDPLVLDGKLKEMNGK